MSFHISDQFNLVAFKNKEVDSLYFFNALGSFALGLIGLFIPVYLYQLGIPIWQILLFYFLRSFYYLILGASLMPIMKKISDKLLMALAIPFLVLFFLGLNSLSEVSTLFYILPALFGLYQLFTYIAYNLDFAEASDSDHVGEEVSVRFVIDAVVKFATPFLGGLIIAFLGFDYVYLIASGILILSIVPLFTFPKRNFSSKLSWIEIIHKIKDKELFNYNITSFSYGAEKMTTDIIWPLFLFIAVGNIKEMGGILSAGFIIGALAAFFLGKKIDKDKGFKDVLTNVSSTGLSLIWIIRTFITKTIPIIGSHIGEYIFRNIFLVSWQTRFYQITDKEEDHGLFVASQEFLFQISRVVILPVFIIFAYLLSPSEFFIVSFIISGILALGFMSQRNHK